METRSGFDVSVIVNPTLAIQHFVYVAEAAGQRTDPILTSDREAVLLVVPDSWAGQQAKITVEAIDGAQIVQRGMEMAEVREGELRAIVLFLQDDTCTTSCQEGTVQCAGDGTRRCERDSAGCTMWSAVTACPAAQRCVSGQCIEPTRTECSPGETKVCPDVGSCRDGRRSCQDERFGPCQWSIGPQAEVCDGEDNDCNGATDDGLTFPACDEQRGVCAGAVQSCGGDHGWLACTASDYQRHSIAYEANETRCDGKDNDCDGEWDEAPGCCQPSCGSKACGADDGCGNPCQTGSCGLNAHCAQGHCICDGPSCPLGCCAANEQCNGLFCICEPDCKVKKCGDPDGCGGQCRTGVCPDSATCVEGECCTPSCLGKACGANDGCGSRCQDGPCLGAQDACQDGQCVCVPACSGKDCLADDGCGDLCVTSSCPAACNPPCQGNAGCVDNRCVAKASYMSDCTRTGCHALPCETGYRQVPKCYVEGVGATTPLCLKTEIAEYWTVRNSCPPTTHAAWVTPWGTDCSSGPAPSGGYIYFSKLCLRD
ncbi:MAG: hypothetical protein JRH20_24505 [Deltaproteobacteria bacterium]|nr:hypothetical protein [Deltaproteobacteria bacterium]